LRTQEVTPALTTELIKGPALPDAILLSGICVTLVGWLRRCKSLSHKVAKNKKGYDLYGCSPFVKNLRSHLIRCCISGAFETKLAYVDKLAANDYLSADE